MSRSVSTFAVATLLFFTSLAVFTSAAPTDFTYGGSSGTSTTAVDDDTGDDSVVDLDVVNTLATATYSGRATWFDVGLGACGGTNVNSDLIVAVSEADWDGGSHCNKQIQITNPSNGKVQTATVRDMCPGCASGCLDMSPSLFENLDGSLDAGVFQMSWKYV